MADSPTNPRTTPASLPEVVRRFWWPVYGEARSRGHSPWAALRVCGSVLSRAADSGSLLKAEDHGGQLRLLIRSELKEALAKPERVELASPLKEITVAEAEARDDCDLFPDDSAFNRRWALVVLELALERVRQEYPTPEQQLRWKQLLPYLARRVPEGHYQDISESVDSSEVFNLRDRFRDHVRRVVSETVTTPMGLDVELAELFGAA